MPLSRRGMSPLIATVLLMAFAVALGGMIMNLSIDFGANKDCEAIKTQVTQFCARENRIDLQLFNLQDGVPLQGVRVEIQDAGVESALTVRDSAVAPGASLKIGIPFAASPSANANVIGIVGSPAAPYACTEAPVAKAEPLRPCE